MQWMRIFLLFSLVSWAGWGEAHARTSAEFAAEYFKALNEKNFSVEMGTHPKTMMINDHEFGFRSDITDVDIDYNFQGGTSTTATTYTMKIVPIVQNEIIRGAVTKAFDGLGGWRKTNFARSLTENQVGRLQGIAYSEASRHDCKSSFWLYLSMAGIGTAIYQANLWGVGDVGSFMLLFTTVSPGSMALINYIFWRSNDRELKDRIGGFVNSFNRYEE